MWHLYKRHYIEWKAPLTIFPFYHFRFRKLLGTLITWKRFLPSMGSFVILHTTSFRKWLGTLITCRRFLPSMDCFVHLQWTANRKQLGTLNTRKTHKFEVLLTSFRRHDEAKISKLALLSIFGEGANLGSMLKLHLGPFPKLLLLIYLIRYGFAVGTEILA